MPVSLALKLRYENEPGGVRFEELHRHFVFRFPKGSPVWYKGFEGGVGPTQFHFEGKDIEVIQAEVKRVLGERPLPADAHFVIRTDWTTNEERQVPLAA